MIKILFLLLSFNFLYGDITPPTCECSGNWVLYNGQQPYTSDVQVYDPPYISYESCTASESNSHIGVFKHTNANGEIWTVTSTRMWCQTYDCQQGDKTYYNPDSYMCEVPPPSPPTCDDNQTLDTSVNPPVCVDNPPECGENSEWDNSLNRCKCDDNSTRSPFTDKCIPVCGPNSDDTDCDGIPNNEDDDIDGDGIPNDQDPDIDGDGIPNESDSMPNGGEGNNDSVDCGSDIWSDEQQACGPGEGCEMTEQSCVYDVNTNISSRAVLDCVGTLVTTKFTWGNCDTESVTCRTDKYSCHRICIPLTEECGIPNDDPDECTVADPNSHESGGVCQCNVNFHYDDGSQSCKRDDPAEHNPNCDYASVRGGYDFQGTTFTVSACQYSIDYYGGGVSYKLPTCDYIGCYYDKDFSENNGTNPNPNPPSPRSPRDGNGTLNGGNTSDSNGQSGYGNTDEGDDITDYGLFDALNNKMISVNGKTIDLGVNGSAPSAIVVNLMGHHYVLFDPDMISSSAWDTISTVLKWVAITSAIFTLFATI